MLPFRYGIASVAAAYSADDAGVKITKETQGWQRRHQRDGTHSSRKRTWPESEYRYSICPTRSWAASAAAPAGLPRSARVAVCPGTCGNAHRAVTAARDGTAAYCRQAEGGAMPSKRRKRVLPSNACVDCGQSAEYYMVHDELWERAGYGPDVMACIPCLEKRLGRPLRRDDFTPAPVNDSFRQQRSGHCRRNHGARNTL